MKNSSEIETTAPEPKRRNRDNLSRRAYDICEAMIVTCELRPGLFLSIQDLQTATGLGRTPIHQAVSRLAADTLILVRPRHGLQVAPIDLARERTLLLLRRDMERFVLRLAAERGGPNHRNQLRHISQALRVKADTLTITAFNQFDRAVDDIMAAAAAEPFLEHTLRPLHTFFRRIGWVYHSKIRPGEGLGRTIECHLAMLDAVAAGRTHDAVRAADELVQFVQSMFEIMEAGVDPVLLDCNLGLIAAE